MWYSFKWFFDIFPYIVYKDGQGESSRWRQNILSSLWWSGAVKKQAPPPPFFLVFSLFSSHSFFPKMVSVIVGSSYLGDVYSNVIFLS